MQFKSCFQGLFLVPWSNSFLACSHLLLLSPAFHSSKPCLPWWTTRSFDLDHVLLWRVSGMKGGSISLTWLPPEEWQCFSWVLQRPAHAPVHVISIICPCLLQDSAAKEDSALLVLWKSSSSLILIAQILKRLQQQWYHRKTKSCIWIPTMYMRCMCLYFAVPTKTEALPSFTNKTVHY